MKLKIPHGGVVFVGDGRKALFLRNDGDEKFPYLKTEKVYLDDNPSTREQGSRPDRLARDRGAAFRAARRGLAGRTDPVEQGARARRGGAAAHPRRIA